MNYINNYLKNLFAINEEHTSTIIAIIFFFCIIAGFQIYKVLDISDNVRFIIISGMGMVAGVNIAQPAISNYVNKKNNNNNNNINRDC